MDLILFVLGFVFLIRGASWLVDGSAALAKHYRVSDMFIGLTIVSIGTSFPELVVNIAASLKGNPEIAIGNIFGSNIANVLLILGLMAVIYPVPVERNSLRFDIPVVLFSTALVALLGSWTLLFPEDSGTGKGEFFLSRNNGVVLLFLFCGFVVIAWRQMQRRQSPASVIVAGATASRESSAAAGTPPIAQRPRWKSVLMIIAGIAALYFGGNWVVKGAVVIASNLGLSEGFVGLTIVALGTSLPELVTSVMAAARKNVDIAVGNIIGSNIFNLLWVIGISAVVNPLRISMEHINEVDILVMFLSSAIIIPLVLMGKKREISRMAGVLFVTLYLGYMVYLFYRG